MTIGVVPSITILRPPLLCPLCEDHDSAVVSFLAVHTRGLQSLVFQPVNELDFVTKDNCFEGNRDIMTLRWNDESPTKSTVALNTAARDPAQVNSA